MELQNKQNKMVDRLCNVCFISLQLISTKKKIQIYGQIRQGQNAVTL